MEKQEQERYDDLKPGDLVSFQIVGRIEAVSERGYVVFAHGVEIPILKSSVRQVFTAEEQQATS